MRFLFSITALILIASVAKAETQAERDDRRSSYIAGVSCSLVSQGQAMTVRYLEGGTGRVEWQEDDVALKWSVEKDVFCVQVTGGEKSCANLGAETSPNEEADFKREFAKNCF